MFAAMASDTPCLLSFAYLYCFLRSQCAICISPPARYPKHLVVRSPPTMVIGGCPLSFFASITELYGDGIRVRKPAMVAGTQLTISQSPNRARCICRSKPISGVPSCEHIDKLPRTQSDGRGTCGVGGQLSEGEFVWGTDSYRGEKQEEITKSRSPTSRYSARQSGMESYAQRKSVSKYSRLSVPGA